MVAWGEFTLTMEDLLCLNHLQLFCDANDIRIVVDEDNKMKLNYLPAAMTSSILSTKSTYATWLHIFMKEMAIALIFQLAVNAY